MGYKIWNYYLSFFFVKFVNFFLSFLIFFFKGSIVFDGGVEGFVECCFWFYYFIFVFLDVFGVWLVLIIFGCFFFLEMIFDGFSVKFWILRFGVYVKLKVVLEFGVLFYIIVLVYRVDLGVGGVVMLGIVKSILI